MCQARLLLLFLPLLLAACQASLARLPGEGFETVRRPLFPDDPLSVESELLPQPVVGSMRAPRRTPGPDTVDARAQAPGSNSADPLRLDIDAVNAPLPALLHALASESGLELQLIDLPPARVTLKMQQRPLPELLDALALQGDYVWSREHRRLQVRGGEAFSRSYPVNYLNMERRTDSSVGLATQVGTINAHGESGSHSIANSSRTRIENSSEQRFWPSLEADVARLLEDVAGSIAAPRFSINREAGLLNLHADPAVHRSVTAYLEQLHESTGRQVLIEATVVEVALSDSFDAGVDWQVLARGIDGLSAVQTLVGAGSVSAERVERIVAPSGMVSLVHRGRQADISATLSLLEQFGDVRILSRPRIMALNNQPSVLKVVDNRVYFTVNIERRQTETRDEIVTESEIHTVPVGLVMNVTPQISGEGRVMLNVRPTLSRILGFVNDPNPELAVANVRNGVPEIQVREMESMLQVDSGSIAIIGGLMQETREGKDTGLPVLGRIPVVRSLFSRRSQTRRQTELLIVLRPTVIDQVDQRLASR